MPDTEIVLPFLVRYDGADADLGLLDGEALGESIAGASRLYTATAHYVIDGMIPRRNYRKRYRSYARPASPGSWDQIWFIGPAIAGEYAIHAQLYNTATSWVFGKIIGTIKDIWTRPRDAERVIQILSETMQEHARLNADVQQTLAAGLVRANDNLASLHSQLIGTLPDLADATREHGRRFVAPVGKTCAEIRQLTSAPSEVLITESDAEVIRGETELEVDPMAEFTINRISEINLRTGHCVLETDDGAIVPGKITDPVLSVADNTYTRALNEHASFKVQAKAVRQGDTIRRLYISNTV